MKRTLFSKGTQPYLELLASGGTLNDFLDAGSIRYTQEWDNWLEGVWNERPDLTPVGDEIFDIRNPRVDYFPLSTSWLIVKNQLTLMQQLAKVEHSAISHGVMMIHLTKSMICPVIYSIQAQRTMVMILLNVPGKPSMIGQTAILDSNQNLYTNSKVADDDTRQIIAIILLKVLFIKYFRIEKTTIGAAITRRHPTKVKTEDEIIESSLPYNVNVIDARWFTKISHSDPFLVNGHWRLQKVGPGRSEVKLVYIETYQKSGYHREASAQSSSNVVQTKTNETVSSPP